MFTRVPSRLTAVKVTVRSDHVAKVVQSRMANYFLIFPPVVFSYRLSIFTNLEISRLELKFKESSLRKTVLIFKEGIGQESNGAANQEKQIFLLCQISPLASSTRDLGTRLGLQMQCFDDTKFYDYRNSKRKRSD